MKHAKGVKLDTELTADQLKELVDRVQEGGQGAAPARISPTDPMEQVWGAIGAVFGSWMNDRAIVYRRQYGIPARVGHGRQRHGRWSSATWATTAPPAWP